MLEIGIPGFRRLRLGYLILDYNGTLACDGELIEGVGERLTELRQSLQIHVLTANTFGSVEDEMEDLPCEISVLPREKQEEGKLAYVKNLGPDYAVCIGNGRNDRLMLQAAALGIAVVQGEGAAFASLEAADVICTGILPALDLLSNPLRLIATLRS